MRGGWGAGTCVAGDRRGMGRWVGGLRHVKGGRMEVVHVLYFAWEGEGETLCCGQVLTPGV